MIYRFTITERDGNTVRFSLTPKQFELLLATMHIHQVHGYRDGETRHDGCTITECGIAG